MAKPHLKLVTPATVKRTVTPTRPPNRDLRTREYLTDGRGRRAHGSGQRQPPRPSGRYDGPCGLQARPTSGRTGGPAVGAGGLQNGAPCTSAESRKALLARTLSSGTNYGRCDGCSASRSPKSPFVFTSERGAPFTTAGFARMVERAGTEAKFGFKAHPHMLRHACGYALANKGHDTRALQAYLGHRNIQHTVRYTELSPTRFKDFWRD